MNWQRPFLEMDELKHLCHGSAERILAVQTSEGAIPWFRDGPWDPWNHTECAMALSALGRRTEAERAYVCLAIRQKADGSWLADYGNAVPMKDRLTLSRGPAPQAHDTNFAAYCAVGVLHHTLCFEDLAFARAHWPMVSRAMHFVLSLQTAAGTIPWSREAAEQGVAQPLLAGNASMYKSLECAQQLAALLGEDAGWLKPGRDRLGQAIVATATATPLSGRGFAMDWYYPVLAGALPEATALDRLDDGWAYFVESGRGCRCVAHEPWVTVAETCELVLALLSVDRRHEALQLLTSQLRHRDRDGSFWMGWQFEEQIFWPAEKPTWTQAAVILAGDALCRASRAHDLLIRHEPHRRRSIRRLATASISSNRPDASAS